MSDNIRILLVDDHPLIREGLKRCLEAIDGFCVVGTECNAAAALQTVPRVKPDIVLLDIDMPGADAFEAVGLLQQSCEQTRFVFLSAYCSDRYVEAALGVKAAGYVTKSEPSEMVIEALRVVAEGGIFYSPEVQKRIVIDENGPRLPTASDTRLSTLTARELEVLRYIARGLSRKEMASLMQLSIRTVECHCTNLMTKLNIHDRVQLARFAIREGLVEV